MTALRDVLIDQLIKRSAVPPDRRGNFSLSAVNCWTCPDGHSHKVIGDRMVIANIAIHSPENVLKG